MSERITRLKIRGDLAAAWTTANPVLLARELGIETDTRRMKMGDGTTAWTALPYFLAASDARGQVSRVTTQQLPAAAQNVFRATGAVGTLDSATAVGLTLGTTDQMALRNTSGAAMLVRVSAAIEAVAGNNNVLAMRLAVDGVSIAATESRGLHGGSGADAKMATDWIVSLAAGSEVGMVVANTSSSADITLQRARISAVQVQL